MSTRIQQAPGKYLAPRAGILHRQIHGGMDSTELVRAVRAGLPIRELSDLREALGLSLEKVASKIGMSRATFHRRQKTGVLSSDESDKAVRLARIIGHAISVFGSEGSSRLWLNAPQVGLGGAVPLEYAETEVGAREVEDLLGRIDYGVYA